MLKVMWKKLLDSVKTIFKNPSLKEQSQSHHQTSTTLDTILADLYKKEMIKVIQQYNQSAWMNYQLDRQILYGYQSLDRFGTVATDSLLDPGLASKQRESIQAWELTSEDSTSETSEPKSVSRSTKKRKSRRKSR